MGMQVPTQAHKQLAVVKLLEKQVFEGILNSDNMTLGSKIVRQHHI